MKKWFFFGVVLAIPILAVFGLLYLLGQGLWTLWGDRQLAREADDIRRDVNARKERRRQENEQRLANGCQHEFSSQSAGFPPDTCRKCGLTRERPAGDCDHVWRLGKGTIPHSKCEKCDRQYTPPTIASL